MLDRTTPGRGCPHIGLLNFKSPTSRKEREKWGTRSVIHAIVWTNQNQRFKLVT